MKTSYLKKTKILVPGWWGGGSGRAGNWRILPEWRSTDFDGSNVASNTEKSDEEEDPHYGFSSWSFAGASSHTDL